jgi:intracellular septation protein A
MTAIHDTDLAPNPAPNLAAIPVLLRPAGPQLKAVIARVAASLATAVVAPAILFAVTLVIINVYAAVSVALAWMVAAMCWRWATKRPVSGLLVLTLAIMTIKTVFTLATGNTFVYFAQPVLADAAVAAIFLGSLWTARPIVARIAPDFYPVDAALAARPRIRRLFRRLTLLWGLVLIIKGSVTLWLLVSLSTVNFVLIKGSAILTLTLVATAATVTLSAIVGRQEGLLRARRRPAMGVSGCGRLEVDDWPAPLP